MPRQARIVIPNIPHHVIQRGNRKQATFFCEDDYQVYISLMHKACKKYYINIWAYCLMPNHVHLIAVPKTKESLAKAIGQGHEAYTRYINTKMGWKGYLWQGRFRSYPMDDVHLYNAGKYIELNPVNAGMVVKAYEYKWSSARVHLGLEECSFIDKSALLEKFGDWKSYLKEGILEEHKILLEEHEKSGKPLGQF